MKANELRIGNIIEDYNEKQIKVLPNDILALYQTELAGKDNVIYFAIELNEEWLIKFGFEMHENAPWVLQKQPLMCNVGNRFTWHYKTLSIKEIKYVHQLQNLYFALTGEELTLK